MEVEYAMIWWLAVLAFIPFVDYNPGKGFLPTDESSEDVYGYWDIDPETGEQVWIASVSKSVVSTPKDKWYGKTYLDEAGIGLVALGILLFSKPWK